MRCGGPGRGSVRIFSFQFLLGRLRVSSGPEAWAEACYGTLTPSGLVFDLPMKRSLIRSSAGKAIKRLLLTCVSQRGHLCLRVGLPGC